jgi:hypothetical protein
MKKIMIVLVAMLALGAGCTKAQVTCAVQTTLVNTMSAGIAAGLQCSNTAAIAATLNTAAAGLNMCPAGTALSLPSAFCGPLVSVVVSSLASGAIPSAWGCTAQTAQMDLTTLLTNACTGQPLTLKPAKK